MGCIILRSLRIIVSKQLQNININLETVSNMMEMAVTSVLETRTNYQGILTVV